MDTLDYFVAGIHDALISDIGQVSALNVKSKTTANSYKNTNKSIPEITDELGVNTFIEGQFYVLEIVFAIRPKYSIGKKKFYGLVITR
jgi:TolB-like protein